MKIPPDIAKQVANREITGRAAAALLGITEQYFSVLVRKQKIEKIPGPTVTQRNKMKELTTARREFRKQLVAQIKNGSKTIAVAAEEAKCSPRTLYRYL